MIPQWRDFKGNKWQTEINVRDFIQENYVPYDGDVGTGNGTFQRRA